MSGDRVDVDGVRIAWHSQGSGPPLLLINGYAATGSDWDPILLAALARDFTVIRPDNRGMGGSGLADDQELTVGRMAGDLLGVLDALGLERAAVVGWSMGGFVAQQLAASSPERVGRLVLLATDPGGPEAMAADPAVTARLFDHSGSPRQQAGRLISLLFPAPLAERIDAELGEEVARARAALSEAALFAQEAAIGAWHVEPSAARLAAIEAPTLVMAGREDIVIPPANSELLAAAIDASPALTFPGAAHGFIAQEAPRVAALIKEFLG